MNKKYLKYIIPIAICTVLIIVSLFTNEWLAYQHCRIYKTYRQEISFLHKYPDSKYRNAVCELIKEHEKDYVNEAFDQFTTLSYTSDHLVNKYESSYTEYIALFPNGEMRQRVDAYISKAREENEFRNIKDNSQVDISRFSTFLASYPDSPHASEVRNMMATAQYRDNSLSNGVQPYAKYYGYNTSYGASSVEIKSSSNHDCVVTVKYNNANGNVAGHIYVRRGQQAVIRLPSDHRYQVFFYSGTGWYPEKEMAKGIRGGFLLDESYSYDETPFTLGYGESMTYTLTPIHNGNFTPGTTNKDNFF